MEPFSLPLSSRNSLSEKARDGILARSARDELGPGYPLVEARIAGELQISSIPVREAIRKLEALAARLAGERLEELVPRLREFTSSIEDSVRTGDFAAYQNHDQRFPGAVVEVAENAVLLRLWDSLDFEVRRRFVMDILQAIEEGNSERAGACLNSHALHLVQHLQQQTAENREDSQVK